MFNKTRTQITASIELFKDNYVFKTGAVYIMMLSGAVMCSGTGGYRKYVNHCSYMND